MSIKGLTDVRRLPRLGKIRLGEKAVSKNTGREHPKALDYFVCPDEVTAVYGEKPRKLSILFPSNDPEQFAPAHYKRYGSFGLLCKGDGEGAVQSITKQTKKDNKSYQEPTGELQEIDCPGKECSYYQRRPQACRQVMNLMFMLPDVPGLGVWQLDTSSFHSIVNLYSSSELVKLIIGHIDMIPLELHIVPKEVQPEGKKKTVFVLEVRTAIKLAELQSAGDGKFALPGAEVTDEMPRELVSTKLVPPVETKQVQSVRTKEELALEAKIETLLESVDMPPAKRKAILGSLETMDEDGLSRLLADSKKYLPKKSEKVVKQKPLPEPLADEKIGSWNVNDPAMHEQINNEFAAMAEADKVTPIKKAAAGQKVWGF